MKQKNQPKVLNAWASYDWANSVYNLTITTAIFPLYYLNVTKSAFDGDIVSLFGWHIKNSAVYSYAVSFSFLIIVFLSPILSGIADYSGRKKFFMKLFTYTGSLSCIGLYFFEGSNLVYGLGCFIMASVGYAGALVFYNAFLPEIATPDRFDRISARGYSLGYIGSVLLLVLSLITIIQVETFFDVEGYASVLQAENSSLGAEEAFNEARSYYVTQATKLSFLCVGIWWMVFAQIAFFFLKEEPTGHQLSLSNLGSGFRELQLVWHQLQEMLSLKRYLTAFFFFSMGVQTVMVLAPLFGKDEIKLADDQFIALLVMLQLIAVPGAYLFAWISKIKGNKFSLMIMLVLWIGICLAAYAIQTTEQFFVLGGLVGFTMGGIQSLARSTYSKLLPKETHDTASFFSFYDVAEKIAIFLGTLSFGIMTDISTMRNAALVVSFYFLLGIIALARTPMKETEANKG